MSAKEIPPWRCLFGSFFWKKTSRTSENLWKHVKTIENLWKPLNTAARHASKCFVLLHLFSFMLQNALLFTIFAANQTRHASKCFVLQHFRCKLNPVCIKMFRFVPPSLKFCPSAWKCFVLLHFSVIEKRAHARNFQCIMLPIISCRWHLSCFKL